MTALLLCVLLNLLAPCQNGDTRGIIPEEFVKARPARSKVTSTSHVIYRRPAANSKRKPLSVAGHSSQLGMTIWRLRPAIAGDAATRIIVQEETQSSEWIPERIEADTPLRVGERLRFSFESPQAGYLYVIDRERYADGTMGDPFLVFPTTRTRGGDNQVTAGRLIEIPAQDDRPNYFTLRQSRMDQTGENLTVIVSREPIKELVITDKALKLSPDQVARWESEWGGQSERFEMVGGKGRSWTTAEQAAGADGTRSLTQEDPGPQTIYRVVTKPGQPMLIKVGLKYRASRVRAKAIR